MAVNAAEWLMALATTASAIVVATQVYLLRGTLDDSFEANLQDRQITACANVVRARAAFSGALRLPLAAELEVTRGGLDARAVRNRSTAGQGSALSTTAAAPEISLDRVDEASSGPSYLELQAALAELKIYATEETGRDIDAISEDLAAFSLTTSTNGLSLTGRLTEFQSLFAGVEDKCRKAMLGDLQGLL